MVTKCPILLLMKIIEKLFLLLPDAFPLPKIPQKCVDVKVYWYIFVIFTGSEIALG
jgi:hypothetical protein